MILAGDIGGTNSRLAIFTEEAGRLKRVREKTYPSRDHANLNEIVTSFLNEADAKAGTACLGIAGPVLHGRVNASNLAWIVDASELERDTGLETVWLINDLEAHASGISDLEPADLATINAGKRLEGNAALLAAGTGLGEAGLFWDGARRRVFASEGGHADFAPRNDLETALHKYLMDKFKHVSCERVLSGPGLKNIYDFLRDTSRETEPAWLKTEMSQAADKAALITHYALEAKAPLCEQTLEIFVGAYGSEAGNIALRLLATGGVFLSGGIAAKILPKLREPAFFQAFSRKGRMENLLAEIPLQIITNERVGLIGAARYALNQGAEHIDSLPRVDPPVEEKCST